MCSTGSSLMPQKKNADSLELIRSKAGRVFGSVRPQTKDSLLLNHVFICSLSQVTLCLQSSLPWMNLSTSQKQSSFYKLYCFLLYFVLHVAVFLSNSSFDFVYFSVQGSWWHWRACPAPTTKTCRYEECLCVHFSLDISSLTFFVVLSLSSSFPRRIRRPCLTAMTLFTLCCRWPLESCRLSRSEI